MSGCFRDNKLPVLLHQPKLSLLPLLPERSSFTSFPSFLSFPVKGYITAPRELKYTAQSLQSWSFWGFLGRLQPSGNQEKPKPCPKSSVLAQFFPLVLKVCLVDSRWCVTELIRKVLGRNGTVEGH